MRRMTRREFLVKGAAWTAALGIVGSLLFKGKSLFNESGKGLDDIHAPVLVVVQLSGGNDGINTLIPYNDGIYFDARPTLHYKQSEVLAINNQLWLHPNLNELHALYQDHKVAIIQGVGYPKANYSHFRSMEIWQTGEPDKIIRSGWLARYVEASLQKSHNPLKAIQLGGSANKAFYSSTINIPVIQSLESMNIVDPKTPILDKNRISKAFMDMYGVQNKLEQLQVTSQKGVEAYKSVEAIQALSSNYQNKIQYPNTGFSKNMQLVTKLLASQSGTRVFYLQIGGFDDHAEERTNHARVLKQLDEGLGAFYKDLVAHGLSDRVLVMVFSEFGRRVKENGNRGTDHGTAAPVFILGGKVKGGLYGAYPSLTRLVNGDLRYEVDFRSVYYTLVQDWLKGDAASVLGKSFEKLTFL
jgi:uncharacterized protein (DUF1501 family)